MSLFDDRPIKRVQIGTDRPPAPDPIEAQAKRLAERAATESRLKAAEGLWSTVRQAAGGGGAPIEHRGPVLSGAESPGGASFDWPTPAPAPKPTWTGHPDDFCY